MTIIIDDILGEETYTVIRQQLSHPGIPRIPNAVEGEAGVAGSNFRMTFSLQIVRVTQPKLLTTKSPTTKSLFFDSITLYHIKIDK